MMNHYDYLQMHNHKGPSGVPLGGIGCGYFSIDPAGKFNRLCVNNVHLDFFPKGQKGFFLAVWQGGDSPRAVRLQRDEDTLYGMPGVKDTDYTGLFPRCSLTPALPGDFKVTAQMNAYSGLVPHNAADSSLPAAFIEVTLKNTSERSLPVSAAFSWGDLIYRGIKDYEKPIEKGNFSGDDLPFAKPLPTWAEGFSAGGYRGVRQFAKTPYQPVKWTFQNYNAEFVILAEESQGAQVSVLPAYPVADENAFSGFVENGAFPAFSGETALGNGGAPDRVENASAVAVSLTLEPKEEKTVRFLVAWFMPKVDMEAVRAGAKGSFFKNCDYGKYYHNRFADSASLVEYLSANRERILRETQEWQKPILDSTLPDWLKFKAVNTAYALYSNTVLTQGGLFSTLEGLMGGLGGTQDQKLSSHPVYEKLFPELDMQENLQYNNTIGEAGDILHFDLHYYHGIANSDPEKSESPTPFGSMIDNGGSFIIQMAKYYDQTGDKEILEKVYPAVTRCMAFIHTKIPAGGIHIPSYFTTYDDASHPPILIYAGSIYLAILQAAAHIADALGDHKARAEYEEEFADTAKAVDHLFVNEEKGGFYAFGCNLDGEEVRDDVIFSGKLAGQFFTRLCGYPDALPVLKAKASLEKMLKTSVQGANGYYAAKIWDWKKGISLDNRGSRCWPFYLESYTAMTGLQLGYIADGLTLMEAIQNVHHELGYDWTQNLWNPAEATYMTVPVTWFIGDVLTGVSMDVTKGLLTVGPVYDENAPAQRIPLYYPDFWAAFTFDPQGGKAAFTVTKTFGSRVHTFNTLRVLPVGDSYAGAKTFSIAPFTVKAGETLDLSAYLTEMAPKATVPALLAPVKPYDGTYPVREAEKHLEPVIDTGEELYMKK